MNNYKYKQGFAPIILIIIAVVVIGGGAYVYTQNKSTVDTNTENTVANETSTTTNDSATTQPQTTQTKPATTETKPKVTTTVSGDYAVHKSAAGFQLKYPKSWEVIPMKLATEDLQYRGSMHIIPANGLINKALATGPYGAIIKNINTQSFTAIVMSSKPGQTITQEELKQELYKESEDTIDEEIAFSQPGRDPKITKTEKTDTSILFAYEYTFNETLFKGTQRSVVFHNKKDNIYTVVMLHYRAKASVYDQKIADTLLNSITFN